MKKRTWMCLVTLLVLASTTWAVAQQTDQLAAEEAQPAAQEAPSADGAAPVVAGGPGADVYNDRCVRCHAEDGQAGTRMGERFGSPAFNAELIGTLGPDGIAAAVREGRENMRAITDLTDEQMDALVAYVQSLAQ
jgi:mono/diheme cytochrome c family protein